MPVATPTEKRQVGFAFESARGTVPAAPTKFFSLTKDSNLDFTRKLLPDPALRGYNANFAGLAGAQEGKGPLKTPVRVSDVYYWLKMLFGPPTSTEQASFTIATGVNDTLDFIAGVTTYAAVVAAGTYIAGQTQADAGSLCEAIYNAIHAQEGAGTYTVSYSRATGFFTITKSTGVFSLLLLSGTNHAKSVGVVIGFADTLAALTDKTGADTYTTSSARLVPFKHTFSQGSIVQLPSAAIYINRGLASNPTKQYNLASLAKFKLSGKDDAPVEGEASVMAQNEAVYGGSWTPVYAESPVLMFSQTIVKIAGSAPSVPNIAEWSIEMDPGLKPYRPLSSQPYPYDFLAAGPFVVKGDMKVYFMDETERAKFLAATTSQIEMLIQGAVINSAGGAAVQETLDIAVPVGQYEAFPLGDEGGFLGAGVKYGGFGSIAAGVFVPAVSAYVINTVIPGT